MKKENIKNIFLIVLSILLVFQSFAFLIQNRMYVIEHDLRVIECYNSNTLIEMSNIMLFDYGIEKIEYQECEEPFDKSILIKLKEIENE